MKKYIQILAIILLPFATFSQGIDDALRYSYFNIEGTARAGAMGNAFGSLGGDFTSVGINPAGVAIYRSNQFTITPSFEQSDIESQYIGKYADESNFDVSLTNISYVTPINYNNNDDIQINFGIGLNRLKDFNKERQSNAINNNGSFLDYYTEEANFYGDVNEDFYTNVLYQSNLIYYDENNKRYSHDLENLYGQSQSFSVETDGSLNEYSMALGINISHNLYIGASLGIIDVYYKQLKIYEENDVDNKSEIFDNFMFEEHLKTTGTGYNGKFGIIYKPIPTVRLGASFHTPTYYDLYDYFETGANSTINLEDGTLWSHYSPKNEFDYNLQTPFKAVFSGAYLFGNRGLISIDYEIIDYSDAKLERDGHSSHFSAVNEDIDNVYKLANNVRVGGEFRVNPEISLRAGYEYYDSPFESSEINEDADTNIFSTGLGFRKNNYGIDVAYRYFNKESYELPYREASEPYAPVDLVKIDDQRHNVLVTFSYIF